MHNWNIIRSYDTGTSNVTYDYQRENLTIHDNGYGAIQIAVLIGDRETLFAFVEYFVHRHQWHKNDPGETCQFTKEQALEAAMTMCNGLIDAKFDVSKAFDSNPTGNVP